jgi:hypothetical protein
MMIALEFLNFPARYPERTSDTIWTTELGISSRVVWSRLKPNPLMMIEEKLDTTPLGICAAMAATKRKYVLQGQNRRFRGALTLDQRTLP